MISSSLLLPFALVITKNLVSTIIAIVVTVLILIPAVPIIKQTDFKKGFALVVAVLLIAVAVYAASNWLIPDNAFVQTVAGTGENVGTDLLSGNG